MIHNRYNAQWKSPNNTLISLTCAKRRVPFPVWMLGSLFHVYYAASRRIIYILADLSLVSRVVLNAVVQLPVHDLVDDYGQDIATSEDVPQRCNGHLVSGYMT